MFSINNKNKEDMMEPLTIKGEEGENYFVCCRKMKKEIESKNPEIIFFDRQFWIGDDADVPIDYCPFCGKELP